MPEEELNEIKRQIKFDKTIRTLVRDGDLYRLQDPYTSNYCSWEIASKDRRRALLFSCKILSVANSKDKRIKLKGLDPSLRYVNTLTGEVYGGDVLMYRGIRIDYGTYDFATEIIEFSAI